MAFRSNTRLLEPSVAALIGSLNVTRGTIVTSTPVAPFAGLKLETVGGVVSCTGAATVVNVLVTLCGIVLPATSRMPGLPPRTKIV